jgi:hypothetical protein
MVVNIVESVTDFIHLLMNSSKRYVKKETGVTLNEMKRLLVHHTTSQMHKRSMSKVLDVFMNVPNFQ